MREWFEQLAPRERLVLGVGLLAALIIVGWNLVWTPLDRRSTELRAEVDELSRLVVDLQRAADLRGVGGGITVGSGSSSVLALVDQTARPLGLVFESTRLEGPDAIYVSFEAAPFDLLNSWLTVLETEHGLSVVSVSGIAATPTPGLVRGQILLART
jgi:general secretion pathway protein M